MAIFSCYLEVIFKWIVSKLIPKLAKRFTLFKKTYYSVRLNGLEQ